MSTSERKYRRWGRRRSARRARRGAVTVEFAVILPFALFLIFGSLDLSRAMTVQQVLTSACREGAREGVVSTATTSDVLNRVQMVLSNGSIDPADATITLSPASLESAGSGDDVTVHVVVPFGEVCYFPTPFLLKGVNLSSQCTMRHE